MHSLVVCLELISYNIAVKESESVNSLHSIISACHETSNKYVLNKHIGMVCGSVKEWSRVTLYGGEQVLRTDCKVGYWWSRYICVSLW